MLSEFGLSSVSGCASIPNTLHLWRRQDTFLTSQVCCSFWTVSSRLVLHLALCMDFVRYCVTIRSWCKAGHSCMPIRHVVLLVGKLIRTESRQIWACGKSNEYTLIPLMFRFSCMCISKCDSSLAKPQPALKSTVRAIGTLLVIGGSSCAHLRLDHIVNWDCRFTCCCALLLFRWKSSARDSRADIVLVRFVCTHRRPSTSSRLSPLTMAVHTAWLSPDLNRSRPTLV